jgi:hypothetical protein
MDEGTQIFKTATNPPAGNNLLSYAPLPGDYYLRLVRSAARRFHAAEPLPDRIPDFTDGPDAAAINRHLRAHDDEVYRDAEQPAGKASR